MLRRLNWLIPCLVAWGRIAQAEDAPPNELTDEELVELSEAETIEVFDERPDKPFDRDTEVRLTNEQMVRRGATDLASALSLLPDVTVRDAGRGGFNVDIRGARKGAVSILIDGVLVTDPYYSTFDVSTIPITDIVAIKMSTTPQSPIDGPGGPGGVIEVLTRDGYGEQLVIARSTTDSLPTFGVTGMARVMLAKRLGLRLSASGQVGARDLELPANAAIGEQKRSATGSTRLEYRDDNRRVVVDGFIDDRHYISPPSDTTNSSILMIDRETSARATTKADVKRDKLQLQAQAWTQYLARRSRYFRDPTLTTMQQYENLRALRVGGMALATHPIGKSARWAASAGVDYDNASVQNIGTNKTSGDVTIGELAGDVQYEHESMRVDAAVGVALPFGVGADPWAEGKFVAKWKPNFGPVEFSATAARKGRVPSLRERFDLNTGNPALGPEMIDHIEMRGIYQDSLLKLEVAPFYKRTNGTVRASTDPVDMGKLTNLGKLDINGVDTQARVQVLRQLAVGASYNYIKAHSDDTGDDPLDRLPRHRADGLVEVVPVPYMQFVARVKYYGRAVDKGMSVGAYTLVEASLSSRIYNDYLAVLRVDDALDARPETRAGYHSAGRVISLVLQGEWQ